jgi:hypothetical protein
VLRGQRVQLALDADQLAGVHHPDQAELPAVGLDRREMEVHVGALGAGVEVEGQVPQRGGGVLAQHQVHGLADLGIGKGPGGVEEVLVLADLADPQQPAGGAVDDDDAIGLVQQDDPHRQVAVDELVVPAQIAQIPLGRRWRRLPRVRLHGRAPRGRE